MLNWFFGRGVIFVILKGNTKGKTLKKLNFFLSLTKKKRVARPSPWFFFSNRRPPLFPPLEFFFYSYRPLKSQPKRSRSPLFLLIFNLQPGHHLHGYPLSLKSKPIGRLDFQPLQRQPSSPSFFPRSPLLLLRSQQRRPSKKPATASSELNHCPQTIIGVDQSSPKPTRSSPNTPANNNPSSSSSAARAGTRSRGEEDETQRPPPMIRH